MTSTLRYFETTSTRWLVKTCELLENDEWPKSATLFFDGANFEVEYRNGAVCLFFDAIRKWGKVTKLTLKNICVDLKSKQCFEAALEANASLEDLRLVNVTSDSGGVQFLSRSLFSSKKQIRRLTIEKCQMRPQDAHLVQRLFGGGSLTKLKLLRMDLDEIVCHIGSRLAHNTSLQDLELSGCHLSQQSLSCLFKALSINEALETLTLGNCGIGPTMGDDIDQFLSATQSLKSLNLNNNSLDGATIGTWSQYGLLHNTSLRKLVISQNPIGDVGAKHLTELLIANPTIQSLSLIDCEIWGPGCQALASGLTHMQGLKDLFVDGEMEEHYGIILESLQSNMTLNHLWAGHSPLMELDGRWREVEFFLLLNRCKRRVLIEPTVPVSLWPMILEEVSGDPRSMYYLLRQKPELLC